MNNLSRLYFNHFNEAFTSKTQPKHKENHTLIIKEKQLSQINLELKELQKNYSQDKHQLKILVSRKISQERFTFLTAAYLDLRKFAIQKLYSPKLLFIYEKIALNHAINKNYQRTKKSLKQIAQSDGSVAYIQKSQHEFLADAKKLEDSLKHDWDYLNKTTDLLKFQQQDFKSQQGLKSYFRIQEFLGLKRDSSNYLKSSAQKFCSYLEWFFYKNYQYKNQEFYEHKKLLKASKKELKNKVHNLKQQHLKIKDNVNVLKRNSIKEKYLGVYQAYTSLGKRIYSLTKVNLLSLKFFIIFIFLFISKKSFKKLLTATFFQEVTASKNYENALLLSEKRKWKFWIFYYIYILLKQTKLIKYANSLNNKSFSADLIYANNKSYEIFLNEYYKLNWEQESELLKLKNSQLSESELKANAVHIKNLKLDIINDFKQYKKELYSQWKEKQISYKTYLSSLKMQKLNVANALDEVEYSDLNFQSTNGIKAVKRKYAALIKVTKNLLITQIDANAKLWPVEVPIGFRWILGLLSFILPGSQYFFVGVWKKALIYIFFSLIFYAVLLPYVAGINNIKGHGIVGLIYLSPATNSFPEFQDGMFNLIEGTLALFFLIGVFTYNITHLITGYRLGQTLEWGLRTNSWAETKRFFKGQGLPYLISLPGWIAIIFIIVFPLTISFLISFTNVGYRHQSGTQEVNWVGFDQYIRLFTSTGSEGLSYSFGRILGWTILWSFLTSTFIIALGLGLAVLVESKYIYGKKLFRIIFLLPWAVPAFVTILFFAIMFNSSNQGLINNFLLQQGLISQPLAFLNNITATRMILIFVQVWLGQSFIFLLFVGILKSISKDIYEAASIGGLSKAMQFFKITMPILLTSAFPLLVGQFVFNFNNFTIIRLFNNGGPLPTDPTQTFVGGAGYTDILLSWIFKLTKEQPVLLSNQALGATVTTIMAFGIVLVSGYSFIKSKAFAKGEF